MSIISKMLGALKMESTRKMENTADGFVPDAQTEVLYHDKFDEKYREVDNYREITFNGKEDLGNYTIKSEKLNRILASKVYSRENKEKDKNKQ